MRPQRAAPRAADELAASAAAEGGFALSTAVALRPLRAERCRLRSLLAAAPLRDDMSERAQGWLVRGGALVPGASAGGGDDLAALVPAVPDLLRALALAEAALRRAGDCESRRPLVLRAPSGAAAPLAGGCAVAGGTAAAACAAGDAAVRCGDGVCRSNFVECYRAANATSRAADPLAPALACLPPPRRARLQSALPRAASLLRGIASLGAASARAFPGL